jgi:hypothetical protein
VKKLKVKNTLIDYILDAGKVGVKVLLKIPQKALKTSFKDKYPLEV